MTEWQSFDFLMLFTPLLVCAAVVAGLAFMRWRDKKKDPQKWGRQ